MQVLHTKRPTNGKVVYVISMIYEDKTVYLDEDFNWAVDKYDVCVIYFPSKELAELLMNSQAFRQLVESYGFLSETLNVFAVITPVQNN